MAYKAEPVKFGVNAQTICITVCLLQVALLEEEVQVMVGMINQDPQIRSMLAAPSRSGSSGAVPSAPTPVSAAHRNQQAAGTGSPDGSPVRATSSAGVRGAGKLTRMLQW